MNLKRIKKKTPQKTKNNPPKEAVAKDTSILDHLTSHLSGDAFTHSNLNSPSHPINKFFNTTADPPQGPPAQEPPTIIVQTPPSHTAAPEKENPNIVIHSELETRQQTQNDDIPLSKPPTPQPEQNNSELQIAQPEQIQQPPSEPITNNTSSPPSPIFGPAYKPLTMDELILPVDFALPILERMLKEAINIDDEPIPLSLNQTLDLRKIKILPLKRKNLNPPSLLTEINPFSIPTLNPTLSY
jgi:hypothetical protein